MPIHYLIQYSVNYSSTSGSPWHFGRDEIINNADVTNDDNAPSFKNKASLTGNTEANGTKNGVKITAPLTYLSNFWRSLEMPLINCKVELSLKWIANCLLTVANTATFTVTDAKLYVPIVPLSIEDNAKLRKLLNKKFKRPVYWNKYKVIPNKTHDNNAYIRELLDASYQRVKRLFVLTYDNTAGNNQVSIDSYKKYFLPRVKTEITIEIDGRNFYDQPINDSIKQYDEVRKISTGQGDDYTTGCLLDYSYFKKIYRLIAVDLSKQKTLDADPLVIQQIIFTGKATANITVYYILEQSKETILEF